MSESFDFRSDPQAGQHEAVFGASELAEVVATLSLPSAAIICASMLVTI